MALSCTLTTFQFVITPRLIWPKSKNCSIRHPQFNWTDRFSHTYTRWIIFLFWYTKSLYLTELISSPGLYRDKGISRSKKNLLLFTWEKNVLNKTYVSCGSKHSLFLDFFWKYKENYLHKKYRLFGGPAENLSSPTISQIEQNWWFYFIYKALEQSVTGSIF